jgi:amino acid transporter
MSDVNSTSLRRSLGLRALTIYGIGDILGAGIYALIGKVAGEAGPASWLSFLIAMFVAGLTGLSYAELVSRYPRSGGEAAFSLEAFGRPWLAFLIGWLVLWSGVVSMSAVAHGCADYVAEFADVARWPVWVTFLGLVAAVNFWGIRQSSAANVAFTLIEACGLLLVIVVGLWFLAGDGVAQDGVARVAEHPAASGVMSGAALAFYAFIGFEDMVNIAEEVREPQRAFPRAITMAMLACGTIYVAVALVALAVVPSDALARSNGPLLEVVRRAAPAVPESLFTLIALVAVANTGLLNAVMGSRLLFGMARDGLLPGWIAAVHPRTGTPHRAVLLILLIGLVLVFTGALSQLASTTSLLLLVVFITVNLSLVRVRRREGRLPGAFAVPLAVPLLAIASSAALVAFVEFEALALGLLIMAAGIVLALLHRRRASLNPYDRD